MFNFFNEIKEKCNEIKSLVLPYKIIQLGGHMVYFEGMAKLITISSKEVIIKASSDIISIVGEKLQVKEMAEDNLTIIGKVFKVERL